MKKLFLIAVAALIAFSATSQVAISKRTYFQKQKSVIDWKAETQFVGYKPINFTSSTKAIAVGRFASSGNSYTLLAGENHNLDALPGLDIVMFTHRAGGPDGGVSGDIRCHFTTDFGLTWDSVSFAMIAGNYMRYPNGAMYNPTGNTNVDNVDMVVSGPITDGTNWINNFFGSSKLDGSALELNLVPMVADTFAPCYLNLDVYDGGKVRVGGIATTEANGTEFMYSRKGIFDTDTVQWSDYVNINNLFKKRLFSNAASNCTFNSNVAFASDGELGYFYTIGRDSAVDPNNAQQPIVWKTTDGGATWTKQDIIDFATVTGITDYIWPISSSLGDSTSYVYRPNFPAGATVEEGTIPSTVDAEGTLHLGCVVEGLYSNDPDSLTYVYTLQPYMLFDVTLTSAGVWGAKFVSYLNTTVPTGEDTGWGSGTDATGWDHSISITKSPDGNKVFYLWTDTDSTTWGTSLNLYPDIFGKGFDITNDEITVVKSFTADSPFAWTNFFMNTADYALVDGSTYKIPTTIAELGVLPTDPLYHLFVGGIEFLESEFAIDASVNENAATAISSVDIYPNPATDNANVQINLASSQKIQVKVLNLLGQTLITKDFGTLNGTQTLNVNTSSLNQGIYMISVIAGTENVTRKLIIE